MSAETRTTRRGRGRTVVEQVAAAHRAEPSDRPLRAGDWVALRPRHVMTHDNTAPAIEKFRAMGATRVLDPRQPVFVLDHDIQNRSPRNLAKYEAIAAFAREQGVDFFPAGSGIGHQILVERLYVVPGALVVAADSHANTYGALGALGTPVGRADAAAIWATGTFWWQVPHTVRVVLEGALPPGSTGKDVILALCGLYRDGEVLNAAVEFAGPGVASLTVDERLTIANMTTEWGALAGFFPADAATAAWIAARRAALDAAGAAVVSDAGSQGQAVRADDGAAYATEIVLDLAQVGPHVAGPDAVDVVVPLALLAPQRIRIDKAYLLSCVNARAADLAAAADVVRGRHVAASVELYVAAASADVQRAAERGGAWQTLLDAGARPLPSGCGPCIGLGTGTLGPGETGISATNRNYTGRMGARDARCYLASPAVVAASALAGYVTGPRPALPASPERRFRAVPAPPAGRREGDVALVDGFPRHLRGRLVYLPADDLDTDGIFDGRHTYRDEASAATLAEVVFRNYDPTLAARLAPGDILLAGHRFGIGSSREQAVTALVAKGLAAVVAGSFSRTYLRNAVNNGFVCVECPALLAHARRSFAGAVGSGATAVVNGQSLEIDFTSATMTFEGSRFEFPPLDPVVQALIAEGGLVPRVRRILRGGHLDTPDRASGHRKEAHGRDDAG